MSGWYVAAALLSLGLDLVAYRVGRRDGARESVRHFMRSKVNRAQWLAEAEELDRKLAQVDEARRERCAAKGCPVCKRYLEKSA